MLIGRFSYTRWLSVVVGLLCGLAGSSCVAPVGSPLASAGAGVGQQKWRVVLSPEREAPGSPLVGTLELAPQPVDSLMQWFPPSGGNHSGTFIGDLDQFGIPSTEGSVVVARVTPESIALLVHPGSDHGTLVMDGLRHDNVVSGSFYVTAYAIVHRGTFVMTKVEENRP